MWFLLLWVRKWELTLLGALMPDPGFVRSLPIREVSEIEGTIIVASWKCNG